MPDITFPPLKLLACQLHIPAIESAAQRDLHLKTTATKIRQYLSTHKVHLVVLPELSSIDYSRRTFDNLPKLAESCDGPSFQTFSKLAKALNLTIVYGYPGLKNKNFAICQAAVGPDGRLIGVYEKLHLAHYGAAMEKDYFVPGESLLRFEIAGLGIAPIICYDIRFPALCQTLTANHGVDLILHCGAYYRDNSFASWHPFVITRAMENQRCILSLNRAGENYGHSLLCPPWMDETHPVEYFDHHKEEFKILSIGKRDPGNTHRFSMDRRNDYRTLPLNQIIDKCSNR